MICEKCEGRGWRHNPRNQGNHDFFNPISVKCRACKGTGYVVGDVKDAIDILRVWKNNPQGIPAKEFKQAIEILEKVFDEK